MGNEVFEPDKATSLVGIMFCAAIFFALLTAKHYVGEFGKTTIAFSIIGFAVLFLGYLGAAERLMRRLRRSVQTFVFGVSVLAIGAGMANHFLSLAGGRDTGFAVLALTIALAVLGYLVKRYQSLLVDTTLYVEPIRQPAVVRVAAPAAKKVRVVLTAGKS